MENKVTLGGATFELRKWPLRPGWKIANRLTLIGADIMTLIGVGEGDSINLGQIDWPKVAGLISDANCDLVVDILVEGLVFKNPATAREMVESFGFEESVSAVEAVLKHNLSFLAARLGSLKPSSGTSSPLARS